MYFSTEEKRKEYEAMVESTEARRDDLLKAIVKELRVIAKEGGKKIRTYGAAIYLGKWWSSLRCSMESSEWATGGGYTGKLRISFGELGGSRKSYPEPKAGFDPKLWAHRIKDEYKAAMDRDERAKEAENLKDAVEISVEVLKAELGRYNLPYLKSTSQGIGFEFHNLSEDEARAILLAAIGCGAIEKYDRPDGDFAA